MKYTFITVIALILSFTLSFVQNRQNAIENLIYYLGLIDREQETAAVENAINEYNRYSSTFYSSGDYVRGLSEIPAAMLLKKRLVQDVNMLRNDGLIMVFDRDSVELRRLRFENRQLATAETQEVWLIALQHRETRKPVFNVKGIQISGRYVLKKEKVAGQGESWIVHEADIYPGTENVPELNILPVL